MNFDKPPNPVDIVSYYFKESKDLFQVDEDGTCYRNGENIGSLKTVTQELGVNRPVEYRFSPNKKSSYISSKYRLLRQEKINFKWFLFFKVLNRIIWIVSLIGWIFLIIYIIKRLTYN